MLKTTIIVHLLYICTPCIALAIIACKLQAATLRVNQTSHPLDAYTVGALRLAIGHIPNKTYAVEVSGRAITQTRAIEHLETPKMDIMWLASNNEVE